MFSTNECPLHQCKNCLAVMKNPAIQRDKIVKEMKKYQCDFNWDFEKNKAKHKSYIALDKILEILERV